ncbi:MAG: transketolase C-terminal domain-containing protein [Nanoarchaeota archaeon]
MRTTFIRTLEKLAELNKNIVLLTGDLGFSVFEDFQKKFPDRFFNVGIAEQNMAGLAAGLALNGKKVFIYSIIPFVTFRCLEQIRNDICYPNLDVVIVGVGSGVSYGSAGFSHHAIDDVGALKSIPNLTILAPSDPLEVERLVLECVDYKHPVYLRLGKNNEVSINDPEIDIKIGKAHYVYKGKDIALVTYGNIIEEVNSACKKLGTLGRNVSLVSVPTLKPMDVSFFQNLFETHKYIFIIEEHNKIGGLGDSIFRINKNNLNRNIFEHLAVNDQFLCGAGNNKYFRKELGLDSEAIFNSVIRVLEKSLDS